MNENFLQFLQLTFCLFLSVTDSIVCVCHQRFAVFRFAVFTVYSPDQVTCLGRSAGWTEHPGRGRCC